MTSSGIVFDGVWKKFRRGEHHDSLRDLIPALARRLVGRAPVAKSNRDEFWATKDVSFAVQPGECLGIIGGNGAGKSTILKLLNGIMRPTRGRIDVRGRIGSLIEISAGFHQDLTGRENVFLQGSVMGMPRALIRAKFDEIVAFSGVEDFIDTPVKRYSSGMNARLGFSIAAHLDPDVLLIDEVLSVGDWKFQAKAYERIQQLARAGLPVVLVTHQLDRVVELSTRAILLERGQVIAEGKPAEVVSAYVPAGRRPVTHAEICPFEFVEVELLGAQVARSGESVEFSVHCAHREGIRRHEHQFLSFAVYGSEGDDALAWVNHFQLGVDLPMQDRFTVKVRFQANVPVGQYTFETFLYDEAVYAITGRSTPYTLNVVEGVPFTGTVQLGFGASVV